MKCWIWSSELIFVVLIFVAPAFARSLSTRMTLMAEVATSCRVLTTLRFTVKRECDATSSVKDVGGPVLEKNYHANARMATVLIAELLASFFVAGVQSSRSQREGQLVIEDPVNRGHCQRDAVTQVQLRRAVRWYVAGYMLHSAIMG